MVNQDKRHFFHQTIQVELHNVTSRLRQCPPDLLTTLRGCLSAKAPNYWFHPLVRKGLWDGTIHFLHSLHRTFPTGLLPTIIAKATLAGYRVNIDDCRGTLTKPNLSLKLQGVTLRDHQIAAVADVVRNRLNDKWLTPWPRGIIQSPTGSGKTLMAIALCQVYKEPAVILVNQKGILAQTAAAYERYAGEECSIIGDGRCERGKRVTIATVQSIIEYWDALEEADWFADKRVLISDEGHHVPSDTWTKCSEGFVQAPVRIALSATPYIEGDPVQQLGLRGQTGDRVSIISDATLVKERIISPVTVTYLEILGPRQVTIDVPDEAGNLHPVLVDSENLKYPDAYEHLIVHNHFRNGSLVDWVATAPKPSLILVARKAHGHILSSTLGCPFLSGQHSGRTRMQMMAKMDQGKEPVVVATTIADEGLDVPSMGSVVLGGGWKAAHKVIQRIGRGRRGDTMLQVLDFMDLAHPTLREHSENRRQTAQRCGFVVK